MRVQSDDLNQSERSSTQVFVDGVQSMRCIMADEEMGCVEEEDERPAGSILTETRMRWGHVEIRAAPGMETEFAALKERLTRPAP